MTTRAMIELMAKGSAGTIDERDNYRWCRVLNRFEMYVNADDKSVSPHLMNEGFWESWITKWVIDNVDDETFFIDIGANTGYYSFLASDLGANVSVFEPNPEYLKMIVESSKRNGLKLGSVSSAALSNYVGSATLNIPTELHGSASLSEIIPGYETKKVTVGVQMLDEVFTEYYGNKVVIKIDAEGEEQRILEGGRKFLDLSGDVVLLLEYTPGAYSTNFVDYLFDNYTVGWVNHNGDEEIVSIPWVESQTDWVMLVLR